MKTFNAIILSIILFSLAHGQEDYIPAKYALSFGIGDNFTLKKFNSSIGAKKILDEKHQIRLFISPGLSVNHTTYEDDGQETSDNRTQNYSLGLGTDYLWVLLSNYNVNLFAGSGLFVAGGYNKSKNISYLSDNETISESFQTMVQGGLRGILGVEWRVSSNIGIHSEYLLAATVSRRKTENKTTADISNLNSINVSSSVLFGISLYL